MPRLECVRECVRECENIEELLNCGLDQKWVSSSGRGDVLGVEMYLGVERCGFL